MQGRFKGKSQGKESCLRNKEKIIWILTMLRLHYSGPFIIKEARLRIVGYITINWRHSTPGGVNVKAEAVQWLEMLWYFLFFNLWVLWIASIRHYSCQPMHCMNVFVSNKVCIRGKRSLVVCLGAVSKCTCISRVGIGRLTPTLKVFGRSHKHCHPNVGLSTITKYK